MKDLNHRDSSNDLYNNSNKNGNLTKMPEKLKCNECSFKRSPGQTWWCRTCLKIICSQCNLLKGHTEHRSAPWSCREMLQSLVSLGEVRKKNRNQRMLEEEISVKEYMAQVEKFFIEKLHRLSLERQEKDSRLIGSICSALNFSPQDALISFDEAKSSSTSSILQLSRTLDDSKFDRLIKLIGESFGVEFDSGALNSEENGCPSLMNLAIEEFAKNLEKSPQMFLGRVQARDETDSHHPDILQGQAKQHFAILQRPKNLDDSFSISSQLPHSTSEHVTSPLILTSEDNTSSTFTSTNDDASPTTLSLTGTIHPAPANRNNILTVENEEDRPGPSKTGIQGVPKRFIASTRPQSTSCLDAVPNFGLAKRRGSERMNSTGNLSTFSLAGSSVSVNNNDPACVTAFRFGADFLTRPVDVCVVGKSGGACLVISDSCGGLYVTSLRGHVLDHVDLQGASASSLAYSTSRDQLFVGVMSRQGRSIYVYNFSSGLETTGDAISPTMLSLDHVLPCPEMPEIEMSRGRWICVTPSGKVFLASGDNRLSALWQYSPEMQSWTAVQVAKNARYQYLTCVEDDVTSSDEDLNYSTTTLATCDGQAATPRLLTVRNGRLIRDAPLSKTLQDLRQYVRAPAAARRDSRANLLIADSAGEGKLFLLQAPDANNAENRCLKVICELGGHEAMGLDVSENGWCFAACMNKRCIRAVQYAEF